MNGVECRQLPVRPERQDEFIQPLSAFRGCPRAGRSTLIEADTAFWMTQFPLRIIHGIKTDLWLPIFFSNADTGC